jgi:hypothetical protein
VIATALDGLQSTTAGAPLPMTRAGVRYSDLTETFSTASAIAIHFTSAMHVQALEDEDLRKAVVGLLRAMRQHVNACNRVRQRYAHGVDLKAQWCWDLFWLARKDPTLTDVQLVHALAQSDRLGQITTAERAGLLKLQELLQIPLQSDIGLAFRQVLPGRSFSILTSHADILFKTALQNVGSEGPASTSQLGLAQEESQAPDGLCSSVIDETRSSSPLPLLGDNNCIATAIPSTIVPAGSSTSRIALPARHVAKHWNDRRRAPTGDFICPYVGCRQTFARHLDLQGTLHYLSRFQYADLP